MDWLLKTKNIELEKLIEKEQKRLSEKKEVKQDTKGASLTKKQAS